MSLDYLDGGEPRSLLDSSDHVSGAQVLLAFSDADFARGMVLLLESAFERHLRVIASSIVRLTEDNFGPFGLAIVEAAVSRAGMPFIEQILERLDADRLVIAATEREEASLAWLARRRVSVIDRAAPLNELIRAIDMLAAGGFYLPRSQVDGDVKPRMAIGGAGFLTERQQEILRYVGQGKTNKEIAAKLSISSNTVRLHVSAILRALGVANRTAAAQFVRA